MMSAGGSASRLRGMAGSVVSDVGTGREGVVDDDAAFEAALGQLGLVD